MAECTTNHCQSHEVQGLGFRHNGEKDLRCMACVQITYLVSDDALSSSPLNYSVLHFS